MKKCNENIEKAIHLADELLELGLAGDQEREDEGCGVLYGVIRDAGFKIKDLAQKEKDKHKTGGNWN